MDGHKKEPLIHWASSGSKISKKTNKNDDTKYQDVIWGQSLKENSRKLNFVYKVQILWEGHKIWKNLPLLPL